jgi:hypothetical protein
LHAEFEIHHGDGDLVAALRASLPKEDRSALDRSLVFGGQPSWQEKVAFATETQQWRLVIFPTGARQLQLCLEPVQGGLKQSCESVWSTVRVCGAEFDPTLTALNIRDGTTMQVFSRASVGLAPQGKRREFWTPVAVAVVSIIALGLARAPSDSVLGAMPGFVAGIACVVVLLTDALRQKLVWHD